MVKQLRLSASDVLALIQFYYVIGALAFFIPAVMGEFPMDPEVYGAAVYQVPAEAWAGYILTMHAIAALGIWRDRAGMAAFGALMSVIPYVAFAALAIRASFGDLVVIYSAFINAPIALTYGIKFLSDWGDGRSTG